MGSARARWVVFPMVGRPGTRRASAEGRTALHGGARFLVRLGLATDTNAASCERNVPADVMRRSSGFLLDPTRNASEDTHRSGAILYGSPYSRSCPNMHEDPR
jgi:hypothetical protein